LELPEQREYLFHAIAVALVCRSIVPEVRFKEFVERDGTCDGAHRLEVDRVHRGI
jgi:hypothetical protein